jgi:hypothetical protein
MNKKMNFEDLYVDPSFPDCASYLRGYDLNDFEVEIVTPEITMTLKCEKPSHMTFEDFAESDELEEILNSALKEIKVNVSNYN